MECLQYMDWRMWGKSFSLKVLNLIISGLPSILNQQFKLLKAAKVVLNLVISRMPSIPPFDINLKEFSPEF